MLVQFRFAQVVERRVEGGHARVLRRGRISSLRSEAYDSLAIRMPEIVSRLELDPGFLEQMAEVLDHGRSPKAMVMQLGLGRHPAVLEAVEAGTHQWSRVWRQVAYRGDAHTLYHTSAPAITTRSLQDDDPTIDEVDADDNVAFVEVAPNVDEDLDSAFNIIIRQAALALLQDHISENQEAKAFSIYFTNVGHNFQAIKTLQDKAGFSAAPTELPAMINDVGVLYFVVVEQHPSRAKRPLRGDLVNTDIAIAVHSEVCRDQPNIYVSNMPLDATELERSPLVLTTNLFPLSALKKMRVANPGPEGLIYFLPHDGVVRFNAAESELLGCLVQGNVAHDAPVDVLHAWEVTLTLVKQYLSHLSCDLFSEEKR